MAVTSNFNSPARLSFGMLKSDFSRVSADSRRADEAPTEKRRQRSLSFRLAQHTIRVDSAAIRRSGNHQSSHPVSGNCQRCFCPLFPGSPPQVDGSCQPTPNPLTYGEKVLQKEDYHCRL
jgi:hypothetical protein